MNPQDRLAERGREAVRRLAGLTFRADADTITRMTSHSQLLAHPAGRIADIIIIR